MYKHSVNFDTLGDYEVRKVHKPGNSWHGHYITVRSADQDVISVHGTRRNAWQKIVRLDCGQDEAPKTVAERMEALATVPTDDLNKMLAALNPHRDWSLVRDIKMALESR